MHEHEEGWTEDRVSSLKKLWLEGQSASQIAKALGGGVTRSAVIGKVHRLGLAGRAAPSQPARSTLTPVSRPKQKPEKPKTQNSGQAAKPIQSLPQTAPAPSREPPPKPEVPGMAVMHTLGERMCKWPIGDPASEEFTFCGRKAPGKGPYCTEHGKVAFQPGSASSKGSVERSSGRYL